MIRGGGTGGARSESGRTATHGSTRPIGRNSCLSAAGDSGRQTSPRVSQSGSRPPQFRASVVTMTRNRDDAVVGRGAMERVHCGRRQRSGPDSAWATLSRSSSAFGLQQPIDSGPTFFCGRGSSFGAIRCLSAQACFWAAVKQQHFFAHCSAERQPHARVWHGKGFERSFAGAIESCSGRLPRRTASAITAAISRRCCILRNRRSRNDITPRVSPPAIRLAGKNPSSTARSPQGTCYEEVRQGASRHGKFRCRFS